jgi:hypothetical protein
LYGKRTKWKSECLRGHKYDDANTYHPPNGKRRYCRKCMKIRKAEHTERTRSQI